MTQRPPTVTLTATYDCVMFDDASEDPLEWGGWCDPHNPWGTLDNEPRDSYHVDGDEPIVVELPLYQAAEFINDFPGAVWDLHDQCDAEQSARTGVWSRVTLHVGKDLADAAFALADHLNERAPR